MSISPITTPAIEESAPTTIDAAPPVAASVTRVSEPGARRQCTRCGEFNLEGRLRRVCAPCQRKQKDLARSSVYARIKHSDDETLRPRDEAYMTLAAIAPKLGCTKARVQQIERTALAKVRTALLQFMKEDRDEEGVARYGKLVSVGQRRPTAVRTVSTILLPEHQRTINALLKLASDYRRSGQAQVAREIKAEVLDLKRRLSEVQATRRTIDTRRASGDV